VQVQIAGKKRMNRRTTRTFGVQFTAHVWSRTVITDHTYTPIGD
jgi:hypothetical protein